MNRRMVERLHMITPGDKASAVVLGPSEERPDLQALARAFAQILCGDLAG